MSYEKLSSREKEVFLMIAQGLAAKDMARRMGISVKTVGTYRMRIVEKTGMKNVQMAVYCERNGLFTEKKNGESETSSDNAGDAAEPGSV